MAPGKPGGEGGRTGKAQQVRDFGVAAGGAGQLPARHLAAHFVQQGVEGGAFAREAPLHRPARQAQPLCHQRCGAAPASQHGAQQAADPLGQWQVGQSGQGGPQLCGIGPQRRFGEQVGLVQIGRGEGNPAEILGEMDPRAESPFERIQPHRALAFEIDAQGLPAATPISDAARAGGAWNHAWDQAAAFDAEWIEKFFDMDTHSVRKGIIDPKTYGFLAIAVDAIGVGIEDNLWSRKGERMTSVQQVEQMVRIANELHRDVATGPEAKAIYQIGTFYQSTDETLRKLGYAPNRQPGQRGVPRWEYA